MAIDFDSYVLAPCMATFGQPVTYYAADALPLVLQAVFDDRYREESFTGVVGVVVSARPVLGLRAASLPAGRPWQGELFDVGGRLYVVASPAEPDGHGHIKVPLRFASDEEARRLL